MFRRRLSAREKRIAAVVLTIWAIGAAFSVHAARASLDQLRQPDASSGRTAARDLWDTAPLPASPPAAPALGDASIHPAEPFRFRGTALDRARAVQCLATAIYYEAAGEPEDGQRAVAQVVLNRVRHPAFPSTVCGVIYQGSEKHSCQFSFACDGSLARKPSRIAWERARRVAEAALDGSVFAPVGLATHYHTYAVTPSWNRSLVMTGVFGAHFFHRWKGRRGTPAAFRDRYVGGEPVPGPAPTAGDLPAPVLAALPAPARPEPALPVAAPVPDRIQPAYADSGRALVPESRILDKWKDSGQPLR